MCLTRATAAKIVSKTAVLSWLWCPTAMEQFSQVDCLSIDSSIRVMLIQGKTSDQLDFSCSVNHGSQLEKTFSAESFPWISMTQVSKSRDRLESTWETVIWGIEFDLLFRNQPIGKQIDNTQLATDFDLALNPSTVAYKKMVPIIFLRILASIGCRRWRPTARTASGRTQVDRAGQLGHSQNLTTNLTIVLPRRVGKMFFFLWDHFALKARFILEEGIS